MRYRTDIVPRDPMWFERAKLSRHHERRFAPFERHGRGPASFSRPRAGQRVGVFAATRTYRTRPVGCPAGLIPGVLALYPQSRDGSRTRSRSSFPSAGPESVAPGPQEPVYWWLLPSSACARAAVNQETAQEGKTGCHTVKVNENRCSFSSLSLARVALEGGGSVPCTATADDVNEHTVSYQ